VLEGEEALGLDLVELGESVELLLVKGKRVLDRDEALGTSPTRLDSARSRALTESSCAESSFWRRSAQASLAWTFCNRVSIACLRL
jgi:hypothetical protein